MKLGMLIALIALISGCQSQSAGKAATVEWLVAQGMNPVSANSLASNKPALRKYLANYGMQGEDDRYCKSLGAAPGSPAYVQCRTTVAANRPTMTPRQRRQPIDCTSSVSLGILRTTCQ